jgi:alkylation response protein AidB-like acyl-CoA dehydrogenase
MSNANTLAGGGAFLIEPCATRAVFAPENFNEEQRAIAFEAQKFIENEVLPRERHLESAEGKAAKDMVGVLRQACDLGFCLLDIPEEYGGLDADKVTALLMTEKMGASGDWSVTYGAHSGIGLTPIILFGNEAQKQKYLEPIGSGEHVSCYALSEPGSGSDALAARTTAVLNEAGTHYILNGTKQWISNAMWMDVGVVFAKVDGNKFTAFIVERDTPGLSIGNEEHKMGLRGSSTCQLIFVDASVPVENVLHQVGKGHHVAFNTLNFGRYKLGASVIGGSKRALKESLQYATERKQFRTRIADFGAIREQVADSAVEIFLAEALNYRIAGMVQDRAEALGSSDPQIQMKAVEEYVIECSISKVYSSEVLDRVIDRCLQWHGGYGFVEDYFVEKMYRDSRVNRIFEGTNEINRLLVPGTLVKRVMQGRLDVQQAMMEMEVMLASGDVPAMPADEGLARAEFAIQRCKWLAMLVFQAATTRFGVSLGKEQEFLIGLANIIIDVFAVDSGIARAGQRVALHGDSFDGDAAAVCRIAAYQSLDMTVMRARQLVESIFEGDALSAWSRKVDQLAAHVPANVVALKRQIANSTVEAGQYNLSNY